MTKKVLIIIILFHTIVFSQFAQGDNWAIIDKQSSQSDLNIIGLDGKTKWSVPNKHRIQTSQSNNQVTSFMFKSYKFFNFSKSNLPVKSNEGWYILDYTGNKIIEFLRYGITDSIRNI